jgi:hypothetical protein
MVTDSDDMISLPGPPPPRPAARQAAIDAALRKFDGIGEASTERGVGERPTWIRWATMDWRPAGALVTAALVAVISIPVIQDAMRDQSPSMVPQAGEPKVVGPDRLSSDCATADCARQDEAMSEPAQTRLSDVAGEPPSPAQALAASPVEAEDRRETASAETHQEAAFEAAAPVMAAPPPPPPPPPSEPEAEGSRNIVVTGSRIPTANMAKQSLADEAGNAAKPASPSTLVDPNRAFL